MKSRGADPNIWRIDTTRYTKEIIPSLSNTGRFQIAVDNTKLCSNRNTKQWGYQHVETKNLALAVL
jgi:hypothetical protein